MVTRKNLKLESLNNKEQREIAPIYGLFLFLQFFTKDFLNDGFLHSQYFSSHKKVVDKYLEI